MGRLPKDIKTIVADYCDNDTRFKLSKISGFNGMSNLTLYVVTWIKQEYIDEANTFHETRISSQTTLHTDYTWVSQTIDLCIKNMKTDASNYAENYLPVYYDLKNGYLNEININQDYIVYSSTSDYMDYNISITRIFCQSMAQLSVIEQF